MLESVKTDFKAKTSGQDPTAAGPAGVWAEQGIASAEGGDLVRALQCLGRSLELDSDCYKAWLSLSEVLHLMQEERRADLCLRVALEIRLRSLTSSLSLC